MNENFTNKIDVTIRVTKSGVERHNILWLRKNMADCHILSCSSAMSRLCSLLPSVQQKIPRSGKSAGWVAMLFYFFRTGHISFQKRDGSW